MSTKATTAMGVKTLVKTGDKGLYSAGKGLYLKVNGVNKASWIFRYQMAGNRQKIGLGSYETTSLAEARELVFGYRILISKGINPAQFIKESELDEKRQQITFKDLAVRYIETQKHEWSNEKHSWQWQRTLEMYAFPVIGHLLPSEITIEHVLKILKPIWNTKKETAKRVQNRIERILNVAKAKNLREGENVAQWRGNLELLLPKRKRSDIKHQPALAWQDIHEFWQMLRLSNSVGSQALQFLILTATRSSEAIKAHWSEIDYSNKTWVIPAERMKARKEHRVPLSQEAIQLLDAIPRTDSGLLFEGQKAGVPASNTIMIMQIRRMNERREKNKEKGWRDKDGRVVVPHGFRSTFRDWAAETTQYQNIVVEQALAHSIGSRVEAAYRRGDLLERRRELMEDWAIYITKGK